MSRTTRKHLVAVREPEFGFVDAVEVVKSGVRHLLRFTKSGKWNDAIDYGAWLAWATPLNGGACAERVYGPTLTAFGGAR